MNIIDEIERDVMYTATVHATARLTAVVGTVVKDKEEREDLIERIAGICTLIMKHMEIEPNKPFKDAVVQLQATVERWQ